MRYVNTRSFNRRWPLTATQLKYSHITSFFLKGDVHSGVWCGLPFCKIKHGRSKALSENPSHAQHQTTKLVVCICMLVATTKEGPKATFSHGIQVCSLSQLSVWRGAPGSHDLILASWVISCHWLSSFLLLAPLCFLENGYFCNSYSPTV